MQIMSCLHASERSLLIQPQSAWTQSQCTCWTHEDYPTAIVYSGRKLWGFKVAQCAVVADLPLISFILWVQGFQIDAHPTGQSWRQLYDNLYCNNIARP